LYDAQVASNSLLHSKILLALLRQKPRFTHDTVLAMWGATGDLSEFYDTIVSQGVGVDEQEQFVHAYELLVSGGVGSSVVVPRAAHESGGVDAPDASHGVLGGTPTEGSVGHCHSFSPNSSGGGPVVVSGHPHVCSNGAEFFYIGSDDAEQSSCDEHFDSDWNQDCIIRADKVVSKVPRDGRERALEMMQQLLQRKRRGLVDLEVLGTELRRRIDGRGPVDIKIGVDVPHDALHDQFDTDCSVCVAIRTPAGERGVVARADDGRLDDGEVILLFDFAVNFPVGPLGERNLGVSGVRGRQLICMTPTSSRDEDDMVACLSDARLVLKLRDVRVVERALATPLEKMMGSPPPQANANVARIKAAQTKPVQSAAKTAWPWDTAAGESSWR